MSLQLFGKPRPLQSSFGETLYHAISIRVGESESHLWLSWRYLLPMYTQGQPYHQRRDNLGELPHQSGRSKALFLANACVGPKRVAQGVVYKQELAMCNKSSHTRESPDTVRPAVSFKAFCQHSWKRILVVRLRNKPSSIANEGGLQWLSWSLNIACWSKSIVE